MCYFVRRKKTAIWRSVWFLQWLFDLQPITTQLSDSVVFVSVYKVNILIEFIKRKKNQFHFLGKIKHAMMIEKNYLSDFPRDFFFHSSLIQKLPIILSCFNPEANLKSIFFTLFLIVLTFGLIENFKKTLLYGRIFRKLGGFSTKMLHMNVIKNWF